MSRGRSRLRGEGRPSLSLVHSGMRLLRREALRNPTERQLRVAPKTVLLVIQTEEGLQKALRARVLAERVIGHASDFEFKDNSRKSSSIGSPGAAKWRAPRGWKGQTLGYS